MNRVDNISRGIGEVRALAEVEIPSMKDKVSEEEWAIRVDLAAAFRWAARLGFNEGICNHFSYALPGSDDRLLFLLPPVDEKSAKLMARLARRT